MNISKINSPWVLLNINNVNYGISCESVLSLSQLPKVTSMPAVPPEIRGVINFRDKIIQLVDTRTLLRTKTITEDIKEFNEIIDQRCQDHLNWINTLEATVNNNTEFALTTDPHKCAFGKWYDNYNINNSNLMFSSVFAKFDKPHKAIHQIAIRVKELTAKGDKKAALELIESTKNTELEQMLHLFKEIKEAYVDSKKEIVVTIGENEQHCLSLSVDKITAIEHLFEIDEDLIRDSITSTEYIAGIGKRKDGSVAFLLNDEYILSKFH